MDFLIYSLIIYFLGSCLIVQETEWPTKFNIKDGYTIGLWMQPYSRSLSTLLRKTSKELTVFEISLEESSKKNVALILSVMTADTNMTKVVVCD